ncbi:hypothetical protein P2G88_14100 [Aliiglaciecola sp. CAU 1673]|uniref:hypothetical protein n=1 Tax=Aliiglaciecola sp. CAU 1673 TaxID=3032595 RepID=UPI0023D9DCC2|nr:hypothetical protein [Aliiglaciecola sp. CAU 1673]MDF2179383.1 hypothetical protein [Aliiglaciecola sp. CAU 1673]
MKKTTIAMVLVLLGCQQELSQAPTSESGDTPVKESSLSDTSKTTPTVKGSDKQVIRIVGEVRYLDLEGGFFAIYDKRGKAYYPLNLAKEFKRHGLIVEIEGRLEPDVMTIQQHGTPVRVLNINIVDDTKVGVDPRSI